MLNSILCVYLCVVGNGTRAHPGCCVFHTEFHPDPILSLELWVFVVKVVLRPLLCGGTKASLSSLLFNLNQCVHTFVPFISMAQLWSLLCLWLISKAWLIWGCASWLLHLADLNTGPDRKKSLILVLRTESRNGVSSLLGRWDTSKIYCLIEHLETES